MKSLERQSDTITSQEAISKLLDISKKVENIFEVGAILGKSGLTSVGGVEVNEKGYLNVNPPTGRNNVDTKYKNNDTLHIVDKSLPLTMEFKIHENNSDSYNVVVTSHGVFIEGKFGTITQDNSEELIFLIKDASGERVAGSLSIPSTYEVGNINKEFSSVSNVGDGKVGFNLTYPYYGKSKTSGMKFDSQEDMNLFYQVLEKIYNYYFASDQLDELAELLKGRLS